MTTSSSSPEQSANPPAEKESARPQLFSGLRIVSLCTLFSRILGLVRDIGMAGLFGNGPIMDAFSVAFRIPNLSRRIFGEGALTAAFLPAFVQQLEHEGKDSAWGLSATMFTALGIGLSLLVLLAELILWALSRSIPATASETHLLLGLVAVMLPYLVLICLAAQISAALHAMGHFTWPALLPILLNIVWVTTVWGIAPQFGSAQTQIYLVAGCVVLGGVLQLAAPVPQLYRLGFRYRLNWQKARPHLQKIFQAMLPIVIGLSVTQLNTLCDSLIAWGFSQPETAQRQMSLPGQPAYPLESGTAAALYFGQRLYQFPLGVFGTALGTVLFPLLARHAQRRQLDSLRDDLLLGLRLVIAIGFPASLGLVLLSKPLTTLLFQHGAFDLHDSRQTAQMIAAYGTAVWAYCGLLIVHRGYYALGDRTTPVRIGMMMVALNLALNFTLIWFLGGRVLALSTAFCAVLQVAVVTWQFQQHVGRLDWRRFFQTTLRIGLATAVMGLVCVLALKQLQLEDSPGARMADVFVPLLLSIACYFLALKALGVREVSWLFRRNKQSSDLGD